MRRVLAVVMLIAIAGPSSACINTFASQIMEARGNKNDALVAELAALAEKEYRESPTLEKTNDAAVARILTGRMPEGIQLLRDLEKRQPGNAIVAANLGTALELSGADEEALTWIRESVLRDPQEHQGSEWVHVKILEAKLAMKADPTWLRRNSVMGWSEGQRLPLDERSRPRSPRAMFEAIGYQIMERIQFVNAPDPILGDLSLTQGDLAQSIPEIHGGAWERENAVLSAYSNALYYGTPHEARAKLRKEAAERRVETARPAMLAAAKREQELQQRRQQRASQVEDQRQQGRDEQTRRRFWALWIFASLGAAFAGYAIWRHWHPRAPVETTKP
jgi:hypothetical protein